MKLIGTIASVAAAGTLLLLVALFCAAVVMRYVFETPIQWTEEMSGFLMIWIVMIGAVVAERDDQHLTIPLLTEALPNRIAAGVNLVTSLLSVGLLMALAWYGYSLAMKAQFKFTQILKISWTWIDLAVPLGAVGIALFTLARCIGYARTAAKGNA
ncbi:TRAP transporter small permease [Azospirillum sp. SYSU D00513]|uniref:TRAP transporter small permease n=1 Tax=Azospirillum sp. SYSU D00513 TaxID=2812561 RepID=UPI001A95FE46|nr:TRAP transporter small permease [Azospirillum sp. SYSU D00513]